MSVPKNPSERAKIRPDTSCEHLKIILLESINRGLDPIDVIRAIAKRLEFDTRQPHFAEMVDKQIKVIYKVLDNPKIKAEEIQAVKDRLAKMQEAFKDEVTFDKSERKRILHAIREHKALLLELDPPPPPPKPGWIFDVARS